MEVITVQEMTLKYIPAISEHVQVHVIYSASICNGLQINLGQARTHILVWPIKFDT